MKMTKSLTLRKGPHGGHIIKILQVTFLMMIAGVANNSHAAYEIYEIEDAINTNKLANKKYAPAQHYLGVAGYFGSYRYTEKERKSYQDWLLEAARQNNPNALSDIANLYCNSHGEQARSFFEQAAKQGNEAAQRELAKMYYEGKGIPQNAEKALYWGERAVLHGGTASAYELAVMYINNEKRLRNESKALFWLMRAADAANQYDMVIHAKIYLAFLYEEGNILPQDKEKGTKLFIAALKGKSPIGYDIDYESIKWRFDEVRKVYKNDGMSQDGIALISWYEKAANAGSATAQFELALAYIDGRGVAKDNEKAVIWYNKAADQGHTTAQRHLSFSYKYGEHGLQQSDGKAAFWIAKSAAKGDRTSQHDLAKMYLYGRGVKQDYNQAVFWYTISAENGDLSSQLDLAELYLQPYKLREEEYKKIGVQKDLIKAVYWYTKAAENAATHGSGIDRAQVILGDFYYKGKGVEKNLHKAIFWYEKAAKKGNTFSQANLAEMYYRGKGVPQNFKKAAYWYAKAAEKEYLHYESYIANRYLKGTIVQQDDKNAYMWFSIAAAKGDAKASTAMDNLVKHLSHQDLLEAQDMAAKKYEVINSQN